METIPEEVDGIKVLKENFFFFNFKQESYVWENNPLTKGKPGMVDGTNL